MRRCTWRPVAAPSSVRSSQLRVSGSGPSMSMAKGPPRRPSRPAPSARKRGESLIAAGPRSSSERVGQDPDRHRPGARRGRGARHPCEAVDQVGAQRRERGAAEADRGGVELEVEAVELEVEAGVVHRVADGVVDRRRPPGARRPGRSPAPRPARGRPPRIRAARRGCRGRATRPCTAPRIAAGRRPRSSRTRSPLPCAHPARRRMRWPWDRGEGVEQSGVVRLHRRPAGRAPRRNAPGRCATARGAGG